MRQFGFPLAPMILGVVLGNIAEINLARALAISDDLTLFVTRPWAQFFLIIAVFSAFFPWFQKARAEGRRWTDFYLPIMLIAVTLPLVMMGGIVRPALSVVLLGLGLTGLYRAWKNQAATKAEIIDP